MPARLLTAKKVTDDRRGQAFVGDEAVLDCMAEVDESHVLFTIY
jgi:hypothetical protein